MMKLVRWACGALILAGCGGGRGGEAPFAGPFEEVVLESTAHGFRASVDFSAPRITTTQEAGETFSRVECEGCRAEAPADGSPAIPVFTRTLLVPQGATVEITHVEVTVGGTYDLLLRPFQAREGDDSPEFEQPGPVSEAAYDWVPPFAYNTEAYALDVPQPAAAVRAPPVQSSRHLSLVVLHIAAGNYQAASKRLTLYSRVEFGVTFVGGSDVFLDGAAGNPFHQTNAPLVRRAWNGDAVESSTPLEVDSFIHYGEELIILTAPAYRAEADRLAQHKNARGLLTNVFTVNDGPSELGPDTPQEIRDFLDDRHAHVLVQAGYLLLLGDQSSIPVWNVPTRYHPDGSPVPTDFPYSLIDKDPLGDDLYPDVALGRLGAASIDEARRMVDKIIQYEADPPIPTPEQPFYGRAALATSFWPSTLGDPPCVEWHRDLIPRAERARGGLVARGYEVQRLYAAREDQSVPANVPCLLSDRSPLPPPLRRVDGFEWNADRFDILAAFASGKSLLLYTGHGKRTGWCDPLFGIGSIPDLDNGDLLPFVIHACCATGAFDGLADYLLRYPKGAIASVGFTRNANSKFTSRLLWSVCERDCHPSGAVPRLGDLVDCARAEMAELAGALPAAAAYGQAHTHTRMLQLHGDPTLRIWERPPVQLPLQAIDDQIPGVIALAYPVADVTITVFEDLGEVMVPIGRSVVPADGHVTIDPIVEPTGDNPLRFFAHHDDGIAKEIVVLAAED